MSRQYCRRLFAPIAAALFAAAVISSPAIAADSAESTSPATQSVQLLGTCGQSFNPSIRAGQAHWTISCVNGNAAVVGWVKDTRADGTCVRVKAKWDDGTTKLSPRACPKGSKKSFELRGKGINVKAYLIHA